MKISKVLKKIMIMFDVTMYRIAKEAGVAPLTISRAVNEPNRDMNAGTLQKIAEGLERIDPVAKDVLYDLLKMPDRFYMELESQAPLIYENPKLIKDIITTLDRLGYINTEKLEADRKKYENHGLMPLHFETHISVEINNDRLAQESGVDE